MFVKAVPHAYNFVCKSIGIVTNSISEFNSTKSSDSIIRPGGLRSQFGRENLQPQGCNAVELLSCLTALELRIWPEINKINRWYDIIAVIVYRIPHIRRWYPPSAYTARNIDLKFGTHAHLINQFWAIKGNLKLIDLVGNWACVPNFKSLPCTVYAVGGGWPDLGGGYHLLIWGFL